MTPKRTSNDRHVLAAGPAERCAPLLSCEDWTHVARALVEMHARLREDLSKQAEFNGLFENLVADLIERLGSPEIASPEQAHIYARSADPRHRDQGKCWTRRQRRH